MKRYQTIVAAAALDDRDATTLRHAAYFARAAGSQIVYLAHVAATFDLPPDAAEHAPELVVPVDEQIDERLRQMRDQHRMLFPEATRVECVERQGSLVPEVLKLVVQKSADLVCIGRRVPAGDDALSDAAVKLLRKMPCSTFIVPAGGEPRYDRILVPVDFSDHAREALDVAAAVATTSPGAAITVLHVYGVPTGYHKTGRNYEDFARSMKKLAEWQWDKFSPRVSFRGIPATIRYELSEKVPRTILAVADEIDASLIVMASHGRTRPAGTLLGHVAESVCTKTTRPLLCVKKKGEVVNLLHGLLQLFEMESKD